MGKSRFHSSHRGLVVGNIVMIIYVIMMMSYFVLKGIFGEKVNYVAFFTNCIPLSLFPSLLFLPYSIKRRNPFMFLLNSFLSLFLITSYLPKITPKNKTGGIGTTVPLTIISHNTGRDLPTYEQRDQLIQRTQADIIVLQEITDEYIEKHWPNFIDKYPYQAHSTLQEDGSYSFGMGILSRYPITKAMSFKLDVDGLVYQQRLEIDIEGKRIIIYNIHTTFPSLLIKKDKNLIGMPVVTYNDRVRRLEVNKLIEMVRQEKNPTIIAGDFNLNDQTEDYEKLMKIGLVDAYKSVRFGFGFSWPANRTPSVNIKPAIPFVRLDYLFHTSEFTTIHSRMLDPTGSDHKPLLVQLTLFK